MVSAGLAGTSMPAGLGKKYEEEVAMPARARVEETRAQAMAGLETLKAQITQGATESARSRALQKYIAQLQSNTQLSLASSRSTPTTIRTPASTGEWAGKEGTAQSDTSRYPSPYQTGSAGASTGGGDIFAGQQAFMSGETGMYTGEGKSLQPRQVDWAGNMPLQKTMNTMYQRAYA